MERASWRRRRGRRPRGTRIRAPVALTSSDEAPPGRRRGRRRKDWRRPWQRPAPSPGRYRSCRRSRARSSPKSRISPAHVSSPSSSASADSHGNRAQPPCPIAGPSGTATVASAAASCSVATDTGNGFPCSKVRTRRCPIRHPTSSAHERCACPDGEGLLPHRRSCSRYRYHDLSCWACRKSDRVGTACLRPGDADNTQPCRAAIIKGGVGTHAQYRFSPRGCRRLRAVRERSCRRQDARHRRAAGQ